MSSALGVDLVGLSSGAQTMPVQDYPPQDKGGRQFTAVGGRRACHVLLCLGLHQNIPSLVTLATGFPFLTNLL
ncbi:hypothetical protein KUCAC02_021047 [Chaenocephalus aceratus]|uniref:Uncharacterized protein n=1 Tax=Chaenocephalus aceratus TaxID=36190 RepID=A0ACB9XEB4_CHAAC|nr:hypothetical protein KUCAC02_021047 [Chaenocephalus aceratus]